MAFETYKTQRVEPSWILSLIVKKTSNNLYFKKMLDLIKIHNYFKIYRNVVLVDEIHQTI